MTWAAKDNIPAVQRSPERHSSEQPKPAAVSLSILEGRGEGILQGVVPGSPAAAVAEREGNAVLELLYEARTIEQALRIAQDATEYSDRLTAGIAERTEAPQRACRKGCSYCCRLVNIAVAIPEALAVAEYLRKRTGKDEREGVRRRIDGFLKKTKGLDYQQRAMVRHPCPLLVEDVCSVHEVRPLACRGWNSLDASKCEEDLHHPERECVTSVYLPQLDIARAVRIGMYAGLRCAGLRHDRVFFMPALKRALDVPSAADRWLAGEPFLDADQLD